MESEEVGWHVRPTDDDDDDDDDDDGVLLYGIFFLVGNSSNAAILDRSYWIPTSTSRHKGLDQTRAYPKIILRIVTSHVGCQNSATIKKSKSRARFRNKVHQLECLFSLLIHRCFSPPAFLNLTSKKKTVLRLHILIAFCGENSLCWGWNPTSKNIQLLTLLKEWLPENSQAW